MHSHLAIDLGAESGRVVRGTFDAGRIHLQEISRFPTGMVQILGHKYWNLIRLYEEMLSAFKSCGREGVRPESLGVDSWGVDYVLLGRDGRPVGLPYAYRDPRTQGMMDRLFQIVPAQRVYAQTGIQFLPFNTLFQLFSMVQGKSPDLQAATDLLMVPDFFHYLFTGRKATELTNASTTACLNVHTRNWDRKLLEAAGIPAHLFQTIISPGTVLGELTGELQELTGLGGVSVVAPATHDTGSAVAAAPAEGDDWAYISCGTWSLMGVECKEPVATEQARRFNLTNEGGVDGTIRLLKNIIGLWLLQRLRADFGSGHDYPSLVQAAAECDSFRSLIDPDDQRFLDPPSMPEAIAAFCRETFQAVPENPGQFVRCALNSLSLEYRHVLQQLQDVFPGGSRPIRRIHMIGGGSRNQLLCQLTADACGVPVIAGPSEATAVGNLVMQARAMGHIDSLAKARTMIRNSFDFIEYRPRQDGRMDDAWQRFLSLKDRNRT